MQIARQRITLAEAQAKAAVAAEGPQLDFSADVERQKMSAEGLMGPFALTDPAAGTTGPWYTNGPFGLTAGWVYMIFLSTYGIIFKKKENLYFINYFSFNLYLKLTAGK